MAALKPLSAILLEDVQSQAEQYMALWIGYDEDNNVDAPHRQRTAVNRLRGYAQFLGMYPPRLGQQDHALGRLVVWQKRLGPLRDLDVMREWLGKCRAAAPRTAASAAQAFDAQLAEKRAELLTAIRAEAKGLPGAQTRVALHVVQQEFEDAVRELADAEDRFDPHAALEAVAIPWHQRLMALEFSHHDDALHGFRVRNKRLRFVLDVLAASVPGTRGRAYAAAAKTLADVHTALGNLNDLWILRDELRLNRSQWSSQRRNLERSASALEQGRQTLEEQEFKIWYRLWPVIRTSAFIETILD